MKDMPFFNAAIVKQLASAFLGRVLPDPMLCSKILRYLCLSLFFSLIAAMLTVAFILCGCICFYYFLLHQGIGPGMALIYSSSMLLLLIVVSVLLARKYVFKLIRARTRLNAFAGTSDQGRRSKHSHAVHNASIDVALLCAAFVEGFLNANSDKSCKSSKPSERNRPDST